MIMFFWSYRQLAEALWLSLYCIRCKYHVIALLYRYAIAIVAKAIAGETTMWWHVDKTLRLQSTRVRGHHSPARCYASPWSCVCVGIFLKLLRSLKVVSEPRFYVLMLYARVEHKWVVGDISHTAYQHVILWFSGIVGWSGPDRHYAYAYARLVLPPFYAHKWLAGVSFSNFSWTECGYARSLWSLKYH